MHTFARRRLTTALLFAIALLLAILITTTATRGTPPTRITANPLSPSPLPELPSLPPCPLSPFSIQRSAFTPVSLSSDLQTYRGKSFRFLKTLSLRVTAYAPDSRCCYPYDGTTTASGLPVTTNRGKLVAADTDLIPLHHLVLVPGYAQGQPVPVLDRGGAIKGRRLDVLVPTFNQAKSWGVRTLQVKIYQPVD